MTPTQYQTISVLLRRLEAKVDAVEERLAWVFPSSREIVAQIDREIDSILAPGGGLKVFAEE